MSTLPLNQETAELLSGHLVSWYAEDLRELAPNHSLKPEHFLLKDKVGSTPLATAAMHGTLDKIADFFKYSHQGFRLEIFTRKNEHGVALLHHAAAKGQLPQVAALIKPFGEHLSLEHVLLEEGDSGYTVLHQAAGGRRLPQIAEILRPLGQHLALEHLLSKDHRNGFSPLRLAARDGHVEWLIWMLDRAGPRLSPEHFLEKDDHDVTCLHEAALGQCLDQVIEGLSRSGQKLLPEHFLLKDKEGNTPLSIAAKGGWLSHVFDPSLWAGRAGEMQTLWELVPEESRGKVDYDRVMRETIRKSLPPMRRVDPLDFQGAGRSQGTDGSFLPSGADAAIVSLPRTRSSIG